MKYLKVLGITAVGLGLILAGAWMYADNKPLETCFFLALGVGVLLYDRRNTHTSEEKLKKMFNWVGMIIAAVILALLIKKDIAYGGFFKKSTQPTIYTLLKNEIAEPA